MKTFCIIDGYSFVFRAYHSLPPLTNPSGQQIGAVYGFCNMLHKVINEIKADMVAVALDSGIASFRSEIYSEYKANRPKPPQELIDQLSIIREAIEAFNISSIEKPTFEADDIIATLARQAQAAGHKVVIVSSDKDLMQLVNDSIQMKDMLKGGLIDSEYVKKKWSIDHPKQVLDVLSLVGDASDNIPGVKGIGIKSAQKLVNVYGSIEEIYKNINNIENKRFIKLLQEGQEQAFLSKKLITLDYAVADLPKVDTLYSKPIDHEKFQAFCAQHNFKSLLARANITGQQSLFADELPLEQEDCQHTIINEMSEIQFHGNRLAITIVDSATKRSTKKHSAEYEIEIYTNTESYLILDIPLHDVMLYFHAEFQDPSIHKIFYNSLHIIGEICNAHQLDYNCDLNQMIASYDDIALMHYALGCGRTKVSLEDIYRFHSSNNPIDCYHKIVRMLQEQSELSIYQYIDKPISEVVWHMQKNGIHIDSEILNNLTKRYELQIEKIANQIFTIAAEDFNIASPKQLSSILFEKLGLPSAKKSKTGSYSTSSEILENLAHAGHDIAKLILQWRHLSKLVSTYTTALPKFLDAKGRAHTEIQLYHTSTGRFSSKNPNLQNIPVRSEDGKEIRKAFTASKGNIIISADYSQIELRLLAEIADIKTLKQAFIHGQDIHTTTAREIFGTDDVTSEMRSQSKAINFGIIYGISAFGLAKRIGFSKQEAQQYIDKYFEKYPGIKKYMEHCIQVAEKQGYVQTISGRRCYINDIKNSNYSVREAAKRAAINAPLQGSSADIMKKAMLNLPPYLLQHLVMQIHDELLFEIPETKAQEYQVEIEQCMRNIPWVENLIIDISTGTSWYNTKE